jgi:hypothetical protein
VTETITPAPIAPPEAAPPPPLSRAERWSDRVNPIFLRELQQAFNGKAFVGVIFGSMIAIFLIGLLIALRPDSSFERGRDVFIPVLMVLTPVMTMVLPMQAFNSMQHELREGAVDQLLMSELSPGRIVRGKLLAAALLALVFMATFAPLLAVTYLLRGIDVALIGICLAFSFLFALGAAAVGMAMGAVTMIKPLQHLARMGVSAGLAGLTLVVMGNTWSIVRDVASLRSPGELQAMAGTAIGIVLGIVLMSMIAAAVLTHGYENRSTPFRVFPFVVTAVAYVFAAWVAPRADLGEFAWVWAMVCSLGALPFVIAAVTEGNVLSPRVRTLVPKNRVLALLAAPFLPGSDRGLLFLLLLLGVLIGLAKLVVAVTGAHVASEMGAVVTMVLCYLVIWTCVLRWLRGDSRGHKGRVRAIAGLVLLFVLACALPAVLDLATAGEIQRWSWPHLLNPFFTLGAFMFRHEPAVPWVLMLLAIVCLLTRLRGLHAGVQEVLEASRARAG